MWPSGESVSVLQDLQNIYFKGPLAVCAVIKAVLYEIIKASQKYSKVGMSCFMQGLLLECEVIEQVGQGENHQVLFKVLRCKDLAVIFLLLPKSASVFRQTRK